MKIAHSLRTLVVSLGALTASLATAQTYTILHTYVGAPTDGAGGGNIVINNTTIYGVTSQGGTNDAGAIYSLSTTGVGYTLLYSFTSNSLFGTPSPDGLQISGSTLYGSTDSGGTNEDGTLYSIGTSGNDFQTLHTFTDSPDGSSPGSWQINGSTIYGITDSGGADTNGTVYSIGLGGNGYQILHNFGSIPEDGFEPNFLVVTNGTIYGTTSFGGNSGSNIVIGSFSEHLSGGVLYSMGTDGNNYTILHNFGGVLDGDAPSSFQVVGSTIFGLTTFGGVNGTNNVNGRPDSGGTLYSIGTGGNGYQILHNFGGTNDGGEPINFVIKGSTLFGTSAAPGSNTASTVYSISTSGSGYQVLHTFPVVSDGAFGEEAALFDIIGSTLYGLTESDSNGSNTSDSVFAIGTDGGNFQTLHSFPASPADGVSIAGAQLVGSTFFGNTSNGGSNDEGVIFSLDLTGGTNVATFIIGVSGNLAFGSVTTGATATAILTIINEGNTNLTVSSVIYPSGFSGAFSGTIAAGGSTNVTVTFAPATVNNYTGTVEVLSDAISGTGFLTASGTGIAAVVATTKIIGLSGNLAFGNVATGTTATATLTITNSGNATLTVSSISYPPGFSGATSAVVPAGGSQNITVTFAPTSVSVVNAPITVTSDATSGASTINASGTGVEAGLPTKIIGLSGNLAFGNIVTGATATAILTISNTGNTNLTVSSLSYPSGFSGAFSGVIRSGGSTNITVTFAPQAVTNYSGTVAVTSDATSGPSTINISGSGIAAGTLTKIIGISPALLTFGNVETSLTATVVMTITNSGNATLTITDISYPGEYSGATTAVIPAGSSTNITVTFAPTVVAVATGAITVASDATSGINTINVSGTGVAISPVTITKTTAKVNFAKANSDSATVDGTLTFDVPFTPTGAPVTVNIGGAQLTFVLNKSGTGANGKSSVHFTNVKKTDNWKLTISLKDGSFQADWLSLGFTNATIKKPGVELTIPVRVTVDGQTFVGNSETLHYTATEGKTGEAK